MSTFRKFFRNPSAKVGGILLAILLIITIFGPLFVDSPYESELSLANRPASAEHLFGMDEVGRDELARIVCGAKYTLSAGVLAVMLGMIGGIALGAVSGYYGGFIDRVIMALCDVTLSFPGILLAMAIVMIMTPGIYTPMIAVGISSMPIFARQVRAQFLTLRDSAYIEAAKGAGASDLWIICVHMLPNSLGTIVIQATLRMGSSILTAATLSFLGMGAQPPTPEWGAMLNTARPYIWTAPHLAIAPGLAITLAVIAVNLLGDALRDYMDPKTRNS